MEANLSEISERIKAEHFPHHCKKTARLNNGSFGSAPTSVLQEKQRFFDEYESQPDDVYFNKLENHLESSRAVLAKEINSEVEEVALVDNTTTGCIMVIQHVMRSQIRSLLSSPSPSSLQPQYVIILDVIYAAIRHVITHYLNVVNLQILEVKIPFPLQGGEDGDVDDVILTRYEDVLRSVPRGSICLAIIDHISSTPSIVFPVQQMVAMCKQYDVTHVFVDGAHSIGQIPNLDMKQIGADYYSSNIHKWCFGATSCSFIYQSRSNHHDSDNGNGRGNDNGREDLHHPIVSHLYGQGLAKECAWVGTRDYSSLMASKASIQFYHQIGDRIYEELNEKLRAEFDAQTRYPRSDIVAWFNRKKLISICAQLISDWGTSLGTPLSMVTSLAMVKLPSTFGVKSSNDAVILRAYLRKHYDIECVIVYNHHDNDVYCRLSCQIYNSQNDYDRLRDAILNLHLSHFNIHN